MLSEWDKNSAGNIRVAPVFSFEVAPLHGMAVGLRLELVQNLDQPQKDLTAVQLGMTVAQAEGLIDLLRLQIDALLVAHPDGPVN
jgi:hypothetical protein